MTKISARRWKVEREFIYYLKEEGGESITVPRSFTTDFASVPRIFWVIFPPDGKYTQAAVVHDFCYFKQTYTRQKSDLVFLQAMKVLGVWWWKRRTLWLAVRSFGWRPWNNHKRNNETTKVYFPSK